MILFDDYWATLAKSVKQLIIQWAYFLMTQKVSS